MNAIDRLLSAFPLYSEDLRINLSQPTGRFQWFLASILFGARISEKIARQTYSAFLEEGVDSLKRSYPQAGTDLSEFWMRADMFATTSLPPPS